MRRANFSTSMGRLSSLPLCVPIQPPIGAFAEARHFSGAAMQNDRAVVLETISHTLRRAHQQYGRVPLERGRRGNPRGTSRLLERRHVPGRIVTPPPSLPLDDVRITPLARPLTLTLPGTWSAFLRAIESGKQPFENAVKLVTAMMSASGMPVDEARRDALTAVGRAVDDASGMIPEVVRYRLLSEVAGVLADYLDHRPPNGEHVASLLNALRSWQPNVISPSSHAGDTYRVAASVRTPAAESKPLANMKPTGVTPPHANRASFHFAETGAGGTADMTGFARQSAVSSGVVHATDTRLAVPKGTQQRMVDALQSVAMIDRPVRVASGRRVVGKHDRSIYFSHERLFGANDENRASKEEGLVSDPSSSGSSSLDRSLLDQARGLQVRPLPKQGDSDPGVVIFIDDVPLRRPASARDGLGWQALPLDHYEVDVLPKRAEGRLFRIQFKLYIHLDGKTYPVKRFGKARYAIVDPGSGAWPPIPLDKSDGIWRRRTLAISARLQAPDTRLFLGADGIYRSGMHKAVLYDGALYPVARESIVDESRIAAFATSLDARVRTVREPHILRTAERAFVEGEHGYYPVTEIANQVFAVNQAGRPQFWMKYRDRQFRVAEPISDESASLLVAIRDGDGTVRTPSDSSLDQHVATLDSHPFLIQRPDLLKAMRSAMRSFIRLRPLYQRTDAVHLGAADVELTEIRTRIEALLRREGWRGEKSIVAWQYQMSRATRKIYRQNLHPERRQQIKCHEAADILHYGLWKRGRSRHILLIQFVQLPGSGLAHVQLLYADDPGWLRRAFGELDKRGGEATDDLREYTRKSFERLLTNAAREAGVTGFQVALVDGWGADKLVVIDKEMSQADIARALAANLRGARFDLGVHDSYQVKVVR